MRRESDTSLIKGKEKRLQQERLRNLKNNWLKRQASELTKMIESLNSLLKQKNMYNNGQSSYFKVRKKKPFHEVRRLQKQSTEATDEGIV